MLRGGLSPLSDLKVFQGQGGGGLVRAAPGPHSPLLCPQSACARGASCTWTAPQPARPAAPQWARERRGPAGKGARAAASARRASSGTAPCVCLPPAARATTDASATRPATSCASCATRGGSAGHAGPPAARSPMIPRLRCLLNLPPLMEPVVCDLSWDNRWPSLKT